MVNVTQPRLFATYTSGQGYDYKSWLERQSHFDLLEQNFDRNTARIVLNERQCAAVLSQDLQQFSASLSSDLAIIGQDLRAGFSGLGNQLDAVNSNLGQINDGIEKVFCSLEYGFGQIEIGLHGIREALEKIASLIQSPEKTWAEEKYRIAQDLFRRQLYDDALEYLHNAIEGFGGNRGYRFDPRPHLLKGIILSGSAPNISVGVVDLEAAQAAFKEAEKYSAPAPSAVGALNTQVVSNSTTPLYHAMCYSAWVLYLRDRPVEAAEKYGAAIALMPNEPKAIFFAGKMSAHLKNDDRALQLFMDATRKDPLYSALGLIDTDFKNISPGIKKYLEIYRAELLGQVKKSAAAILNFTNADQEVLSLIGIPAARFRSLVEPSQRILDGSIPLIDLVHFRGLINQAGKEILARAQDLANNRLPNDIQQITQALRELKQPNDGVRFGQVLQTFPMAVGFGFIALIGIPIMSFALMILALIITYAGVDVEGLLGITEANQITQGIAFLMYVVTPIAFLLPFVNLFRTGGRKQRIAINSYSEKKQGFEARLRDLKTKLSKAKALSD